MRIASIAPPLRAAVLAVLASFPSAVCAAPGLPSAGQEVEIDIGAANPMKVWLPENYDAARTWPLLVFYHGAGGRPTVDPPRKLAGGRDWIVVGMPYLEPEQKNPPKKTNAERDEINRREDLSFQKALAWVRQNARVDDRRVFVGGLSKGGWSASVIADFEIQRLAGAVILLAGRAGVEKPPPAALWRGKAVYIGTGEDDTNMPLARRAVEHYREQGAAVTFEEFEGIGHAMPSDAPRLSAWLQAHGPMTSTAPEARAAALGEWFTNAVSAASAATDPAKKFSALRDVFEDPRLAMCGPASREAVGRPLQALLAMPSVRESYEAEKKYGQLLRAENKMARLSDMKAVLDGYESLMKSPTSGRWGKLAAEDHERLMPAYRKSLEATAAANPRPAPSAPTSVTPSFPTSNTGTGRGGVPIMRRDGNTIKFDR